MYIVIVQIFQSICYSDNAENYVQKLDKLDQIFVDGNYGSLGSLKIVIKC